ncbi:MAG: 16S rRNA (uracil(1498)-N(3))-methyltransferase [Treponema sp.]|nr:16S rRNA (uracil(1498)-N(3))-methyltransferase [Treponema sp.]
MNIILFEEKETDKPLKRRDARAIHLTKVLRKKIGDTFEAGVLEGNRGLGRIDEITPDGSIIFSLDLCKEPPPRCQIRMAVGFPRPIQIRRLLRDLSNLGIEKIDLIGLDLGEKSYRDTKLLTDGGARAALIEGCIQARDTRLPALASYTSLDKWLMTLPSDKTLIALDNIRPAGSFAGFSCTGKSLILAIGSERGWSDRERERLEEAGFLRLSMGDRVLRTETACVAAAILAMEKIGDLG